MVAQSTQRQEPTPSRYAFNAVSTRPHQYFRIHMYAHLFRLEPIFGIAAIHCIILC